MRALASPAHFCIVAAWLVMGFATVFRARPPQARETHRAGGWSWGLFLQIVSIGMLWAFALLAAASVAVILAAQRALGRQFAYQARLVEGHRLITAGPYRYVRNPIYTALFGLALATGLVVSRWFVLPVFAALYIAGTVVRIRIEERLLRAAFGPEFEAYARRVPALIPIPFRSAPV